MTERSLIDEHCREIGENYKEIMQRIAEAAVRAGRSPGDVRFMAVTKTVPPVFINHAVSLGVDLIGENKVQELLSKLDDLEDKTVEKHIIGHLQSNKARKIVGVVSTVQSADSVSVVRELSRQSVKAGVETAVLLEVNIGEEASKTGFAYADVRGAAGEIAQLPGIRMRGLMAVPPLDADESALRGYFSKMRRLFEDMRGDYAGFDTLSLGMSHDYPIAIEEGATLVRVGSALFGRRTY